MNIIETEKFIKYIAVEDGCVVYDGTFSGNEIVVPKSLDTPKESFVEVPAELIPDEDYFNQHSEYDDDNIWDSIQNYGNQTDYSYAFSNWSANKQIIPKYPLRNVDKCMYALKDCTGIVDARNLIFHITNENPNMLYVCTNCSSMVYAPRFVFYNAPVVRNYMSMYSGCLRLEKVSVYWGDGTADPIVERTGCQNMFFKCWDLKDVEFIGEEVGSPLYLDLSYTEKLNYSSMLSLAKSLKTIDATEATTKNSVHEITVSEVTQKLFSGESVVPLDDIEVSGIAPTNGDTTYEDATVVLPSIDSSKYLSAISIDYEIVPETTMSETNFYAAFHTPLGVIKGAENSLTGSLSLSIVDGVPTVNTTALSELPVVNYSDITSPSEDVKGVSVYVVNTDVLCSVKVTVSYKYSSSLSDFTSKNWTLKTEVRSTTEAIL